jgi:hypothetical protein
MLKPAAPISRNPRLILLFPLLDWKPRKRKRKKEFDPPKRKKNSTIPLDTLPGEP